MTVLKARVAGVGQPFQTVLAGYSSNVFVGPSPPLDPNIEFWVDTDGTLPVVPWIPLPLVNSWANFSGAWSQAGYRKVGDKVEVRGLIANPVSQGMSYFNTITTLPVGFRPPTNNTFTVISAPGGVDKSTRFDVSSNGEIIAYWAAAGTMGYLSMDGINFSVTA